jgi:CelD/BcsL family acetyltransferase involved in cellulose biosynthesis
MDILEITDDAAFETLEHDWRALHALGRSTPFQSWEWMSSWWRHARRGSLWVLVARQDGVAVGILPLHRDAYHGLPLRRVSFLATPISDYHGLLAAPEHADACARAFVAFLMERASEWDVIDLPDLPVDSPLVRAAPEAELRAVVTHHRVCPVIALKPTWDEQRAALGKSLRTRVGQKRRQLERNFEVAFDVVGGDELGPALDELFWLHNQRWRRRGLRGAFADARIRRFHQDVARRFQDSGWLRLHRLRLDGKTRAMFYCFAYGERVYYYLSGFDLALARYSLGTVLMAQAVADSIARGAHEFDLLRGDENYKREWRADERATMRLVLGKPRSLRSRVALGVSWLERRLEHEASRLRNRLWGNRPAPVKAS